MKIGKNKAIAFNKNQFIILMWFVLKKKNTLKILTWLLDLELTQCGMRQQAADWGQNV